MTFEDAEYGMLERECYDSFQAFASDLVRQDPIYGHVCIYNLAIFNDISRSDAFRHDVVLLGGFGVLCHMIDSKGVNGNSLVKKWRTSHDLDLAFRTKAALGVLKPYLAEDRKSTSIANKRAAKLFDTGIEDYCLQHNSAYNTQPIFVQGDLYYPGSGDHDSVIIAQTTLTEDDFRTAKIVNMFGIPIRVLDLYKILGMKLSIETKSDGLPREKDIVDITNLMGVSEGNNRSADHLLCSLNPVERLRLGVVIDHVKRAKEVGHQDEVFMFNDYTLTPASRDFVNEVIERIKTDYDQKTGEDIKIKFQ